MCPMTDAAPDHRTPNSTVAALAADGSRSTEDESVRLLRRSQLPPHEAERLIRAVTGASRAEVVGGILLDRRSADEFRRLAARRLAGEPLQYLEGTVQFGPLTLEVDRRVLIPRPETEQLWELAMQLLPRGSSIVVDMGTGSGCLALAIKHERPDATVLATDISLEAVAVARNNAARLDLDVEFRHGNRLAALDPSLAGSVTMIVTNPPYIPEDEWAQLPREIREHEPKVALVVGDGLDMYRYLANDARGWLAPGGILVTEIGAGQGEAVHRLFAGRGWKPRVSIDWTGRDRFLTARKRT